LTALEAGYRHIDSAQYYANEQLVGDAVKESNVDRKDVFITTKILFPGKDEEETYQSLVESVNKIDQGGYVDLFLIHSPSSGPEGRKTMWTALERLHKEGKAKAIGVSNFGKGQIEELKSFAKVYPPHVNQIEVCWFFELAIDVCIVDKTVQLHPWNQQRVAVEFCQANNIIVEAYCPLVRNQKADDPTLKSLSEKYKKSTGQVLIRYCLQKGWVSFLVLFTSFLFQNPAIDTLFNRSLSPRAIHPAESRRMQKSTTLRLARRIWASLMIWTKVPRVLLFRL
jgi:diketogulonate reductase-like aldo/keto reductase